MEAVPRLRGNGKGAGFPGRHIGHLQGTDRSAAMDGNGYHMAFLARGQGKKKDNEAETLSHRHSVKEKTRQGANRAGNKDKKKRRTIHHQKTMVQDVLNSVDMTLRMVGFQD